MVKGEKQKIGFDLDGVLADHKKIKKKTADKNYIYGKASLGAGVMAGARGALKTLGKDHEVFVISRRRPDNRRYARKWLKDNLDFPKNKIFFADRDEDKAKIVKKLGINAFIDDKMSVLKHIKGRTGKFLFDESEVYKKDRYGSIKVVRSLKDFLRLVI